MATKTAKPAADGKGKDADGEGASTGKGRKLVLMIVVGVLVLGAAGAGGFWWFAVRTPPPPPPPEPGEVVSLEPISLNLAEGRYLKVGIALQMVAGGDAKKGHDGSKALDLAIDMFSGRTMEELSDPVRREEIKEQLLLEVEEAYYHKVLDIYFTEFVMQ